MSSKQPAGASSSRSNRRHSLPTAESQHGPSGFNKFANPMMWPMNPIFNPYMMPGPSAAASGSHDESSSTTLKPWDASSEDTDEEDDFIPAKKHRGAAAKTKKQTQDMAEKKGPGRPTKSQVNLRSNKESYSKIISKYPPAFHMSDSVAYLEKDECPACRIFKGKVAFKPCGHCSYCYSCTNKLRTEALKLKRIKVSS